ncbi:MAG: hypothetical protein ACJAS1_003447 [Oleiphilaceae bacterium]|jgi:hypothetical protein
MSRYKSVTTVRVRFSQSEFDLIKKTIANSYCKTSTSFFRNLLNQAIRNNATLNEHDLKLIIAEDLKPDEKTIPALRSHGRIINDTNKCISSFYKAPSNDLNVTLEQSIEEITSIVNDEIASLSLGTEVVLKENISSQKNDMLTREMNPSFEDYQLKLLTDFHVISGMKSLSNFIRVLILSLIQNGYYTFNISNNSSAEFRFHLTQISNNLRQSAYIENITPSNLHLIQKCQLNIARLMIVYDQTKYYTVLENVENKPLILQQLINAVAA